MSLSLVDASNALGPPSRLTGDIIDLLRALEVETITFSLNGGGDSGETSVDEVRYLHGRIAHDVPPVPIAITNDGQLVQLDALLANTAADAPDGDWVNNEGGFGSVTVQPFEDDPFDWLVCDMTYRDDDPEEEDDEDGDPSLADSFDVRDGPGDATAPSTITVVGEVQS